jgi:hypothetical protein
VKKQKNEKNKMFAKRKNRKPTHGKHIPMKNREELFTFANAE